MASQTRTIAIPSTIITTTHSPRAYLQSLRRMDKRQEYHRSTPNRNKSLRQRPLFLSSR